MKYKVFQTVKVKSGFYEGCSGILVEHTFRDGSDHYLVEITYGLITPPSSNYSGPIPDLKVREVWIRKMDLE